MHFERNYFQKHIVPSQFPHSHHSPAIRANAKTTQLHISKRKSAACLRQKGVSEDNKQTFPRTTIFRQQGAPKLYAQAP